MGDAEARIAGAVDGLVASEVLRPVALHSPEERLFADCDLASLAENRLAESVDPRGIDPATRARFLDEATDETQRLPSERAYERCFWLMDEGERLGTVSLLDSSWGSSRAYLASLYVFPDRRGRGLGARAMRAIRDALAARRMGLRLDTSWLWQDAVRFYLRLGMRCWMWKRSLSFCWDLDAVTPALEVEGARAALTLGPETTVVAAHDGAWLSLEDGEGHRRGDAHTHLALELAMRGWPLLRSEAERRRHRASDAGAPEALADRIEVWEAYARHMGWRVETPRIPGLTYPSWAELQRAWTET